MNENNPLVCVIDDESVSRESLSFLLRSAGRAVRAFSSAQEFLTNPPVETLGCLLVDVQLPGLSGLDLQQELARSGAQIPLIFMTGYGDIPTSVRAIKAGAIEFLTKPFSVLQDKSYERVGEEKTRHADVRIIAAQKLNRSSTGTSPLTSENWLNGPHLNELTLRLLM